MVVEHEDTFAPWYEAEHPRVLASITLVTGDLHLAQDAVDEAFARALDRWSRVATLASPGGWTTKVALNVARRQARRRAREREVLGRLAGETELPEHAKELWLVVASLAPRQREVVVLRYVGDLTEAGIATVLGVTRGTVSRTLRAAHERLGALLGDEKGESCDVTP